MRLLWIPGSEPMKSSSCAAKGGHETLVRLLLEKGANPSKGIGGAAQGGHESIVRLLLDKGAMYLEGEYWRLLSVALVHGSCVAGGCGPTVTSRPTRWTNGGCGAVSHRYSCSAA